jgi:hypothetical protein
MNMQPHPIVMSTLAEHRAADLRTQAHRYRLAKLASGNGDSNQQAQRERFAVLAIALTLALLVVGRAGVADVPIQTRQGLPQPAAQIAVPMSEAGAAETSAVQKVREAAH